MRFPTFCLASAAASLLLAVGGDAFAECKHAVHWTSDAVLPLARVCGTRIEAEKNSGGANGDRWHTIDRWGRVVGEVELLDTAHGGERFKLVSGSQGASVFVRGPWRAPTSAALTPEPALRASLEHWLGKGDKKRDIQFFRAEKPGAPEAFAVVTTPRSITVAYKDGTKWRRAFRQVHDQGRWHPLYRLRAIVDMNGDGLPEVIYHFNEYDDGNGFEVVLAPKRGGKVYEEASSNIDDGP